MQFVPHLRGEMSISHGKSGQKMFSSKHSAVCIALLNYGLNSAFLCVYIPFLLSIKLPRPVTDVLQVVDFFQVDVKALH